MLADYHVHTAFSSDSDYPMEQVVADAIALGLQELCFTEHTDYGTKRDHDDPRGFVYCRGDHGEPENMPMSNVDHPRYFAAVRALQERYADRIALKFGAEFGIQTHTIPQFEALRAKYPYDFILLSVHQVEDKEFWTQEFQQGRSQREYNLRYYEELLALTERWQGYSILAHMDLITRYDPAGLYPFENVRPLVTRILENVIANGKGIEVNTSSHRYGLRDLTPSREILKLYRQLGGEILTIGSDSHKPAHLGKYILQTQQELKDMGFTYHCTFEKMQPVFHKL